MVLFRSLGLIGLLASTSIAAITIVPTDPDSVKAAAKAAASGMVRHYTGDKPGDTPGNLPDPYYWWEAGAMFGALIDYWYFTKDDQWNDITIQAMMHQSGPDAAFMPLNQTKSLGNDDQSFWGMAAMSAAENKFPNPPEDQPQWLALAQAVFETQAARWHNATCGGGLKWQIFAFNNGYNYKNTISNGCFFNIAARLATYTGEQRYADWAVKTWDWMWAVGLIDEKYNFWDGSDDNKNCTEYDHHQWSYNPGTFLIGAANMYNFTGGSPLWEDRLRKIIGNLGIFFHEGDTLFEAICEGGDHPTCNIDQRSFKAYLARWMGATIVRAPFTRPLLKPWLESSAIAAAQSCVGGDDGNQCGMRWWKGGFDGFTGVGEQMSALEVFQSNLIDYTEGPATLNTGISKGDPNAGQTSKIGPEDLLKTEVTTADRAGAGILTVIVCLTVVGTAWWMVQ